VAPHQALFRAELPSSTVAASAAVRWDFGDGQSAEGSQVTHVYAQPGQYTVTATANASGSDMTATTQVSVATAAGAETPATQTPQPAPGSSTASPPLSGGGEAGAGCSTAPVGALLPLGLLALAGLLRRRRWSPIP
jgi:uncharacterized protein (TIGR03382 family)